MVLLGLDPHRFVERVPDCSLPARAPGIPKIDMLPAAQTWIEPTRRRHADAIASGTEILR